MMECYFLRFNYQMLLLRKQLKEKYDGCNKKHK